MGWSQTGADRMSKLRCYERNYGREKIIDLVKYSREQRKQKRTGTDNEIIEKVSLRQIRAEHYDQANCYKQVQKHTINHTCLITVYLQENGSQGCYAPEAPSLTPIPLQIKYQPSRNE